MSELDKHTAEDHQNWRFELLLNITFQKLLKSYHCIWFCTLLLYFGIPAYLFSPDEGSCYIFWTQNNSFEFLASYGVILQSDIQPYNIHF